MKKKIFSIALATIISLSSINSVYGVSVNAVENFTVGLSKMKNSFVITGKQKGDVTSFEELLTMSENELMKYCEVNEFTFVSQEVIKSDLQSGGNFFLRINPKKYHLNNSDDVCIAENIRDINKYNVNEYDFNKMISELNLPEKYYNIKLDNNSFMVCMESTITDGDNMKPYYIKLANLNVTVNSEYVSSDLSLRLYQLIRILPQSVSSFHSVSVQYSGITNNNSDNESADFENLLNMNEDELRKYCEQFNLKYISSEDAINNIKLQGTLNAMMKVDSYIKEGKNDITISSDISDINQHNTIDYNFEKMVSELDLPEEYYDIQPDTNLFATLQDSKKNENTGEIDVFFVKLARISIKIKSEYLNSKENVRLYQLAMIFASKCNEVHSFSIQYSGAYDESSNENDFPDTLEEYETFIREHGNVSIQGKYIIFCGEINFSTGAKLTVKQSGTAEIKEYKHYSISDNSIEVGGSTSKIVYVYEAITSGEIKISFLAGRPWEESSSNIEIIGYYEIEDDFTIIEKKEIVEAVKGDINGDNMLNIADAVVLQKWLLAVPDVELVNWKAGDLCEDDKLDVFDLCLMKRALIEKLNDIPQNVNTSFKLHGVADIRTNGDNHTKWTGYIARSKSDLLDIIQENEGVSADEISLEDIDDNAFNDKSLVIIYGICTAGNSYSIIDDISIKGTDIDVSTVSKKPEIATPDMLYRRYIYIIDKNLATNVNGFIFNDTSSYYQFEEEADIVNWFKDWCRS